MIETRPYREWLTLGVIVALAAAVVAGVWLTQSKTSRNRQPSSVGDTQSVSGYTVVYAVTGDSGVNVTYQTQSGVTQQQDAAAPWTDAETMDAGGIPIVSAQNTGSGTVTCSITVNGVLVASNEAVGDYAIASCNGDMLGAG